MSMQTLRLSPLDAWFFRDGRPYNQRESAQTDVRTLFPPFAPSIVGTIRAAFARGQGWNGRGVWAESLNRVLGSGFDDLGRLMFHGPFLLREGRQWLFPVPLHLLGSGTDNGGKVKPGWSPSAFLAPSISGTVFESDLGPVPFAAPIRSSDQRGQLKEPTGLWITTEGYSEILRGRMPNAGTLSRPDHLWKTERRVGLARDHDRRAAKEGELYSPEYVRLQRGVELRIAVEGIPEDWVLPDLIAFGGESRMAHCESQSGELPLPQSPDDLIRDSNHFTVILLTTLCLPKASSGRPVSPMPGESFPGLMDSAIVSACVGKPVYIGGWNSLNREPLPLTPCLPAGSIWFCEAHRTALDSILRLHGRHVGERTEFGFGQIALGAWPQEIGDTK